MGTSEPAAAKSIENLYHFHAQLTVTTSIRIASINERINQILQRQIILYRRFWNLKEDVKLPFKLETAQ